MLRRLLVVTLAWMLLASASAEGNRTLACSASQNVSGCWIEAPVYASGPFEVGFGIDAQLAYDGVRTSFLAPYAVLGWYAPTWAAWAELALPQSRFPTFGKPEPWRVGFRLRF